MLREAAICLNHNIYYFWLTSAVSRVAAIRQNGLDRIYGPGPKLPFICRPRSCSAARRTRHLLQQHDLKLVQGLECGTKLPFAADALRSASRKSYRLFDVSCPVTSASR